MTLSAPSDRAWKDGDKFVAVYTGRREEKIKGDKAGILMFLDSNAAPLERWETAIWARLIASGELWPGRPIEVEALPEAAGKGGKRFRPFVVTALSGHDVPKSLRDVSMEDRPEAPHRRKGKM